MGKASNEEQKILPEFRKLLLERKLVPERQSPLYPADSSGRAVFLSVSSITGLK